ncbi:MAG: AI-2E family transporter [Chloroflexi bacterium]|nr:MAG: AI-2E family transporter [Chloroflexota bacterium]
MRICTCSPRDAARVIAERLVRFRLRTILSLLATIIAVAVVLEVVWIARHVITWVLIALFLALALNPAVGWFQRHGLSKRGGAVAVTSLLTLAFFVAIGFLFVPTLVHQVNEFVNKLPDYVHDVTHGRRSRRA